DYSVPKLAANNNTCEDCNRQLCSASNLKRHRATCKIVMQKQYSRNGTVASPVSKPVQQQKWQPVEIAARERMIIDRSYAAALAASQEAHPHGSQQQPQMLTRTTSDNTGTFVIVQDQGIVGERPWITVGEHLRAQHMQQKVLEAQNQQNQNAIASSASTVEKFDSEGACKSANNNNNNETVGIIELSVVNFALEGSEFVATALVETKRVPTRQLCVGLAEIFVTDTFLERACLFLILKPCDEQYAAKSESTEEEKPRVQESAPMAERKSSAPPYKCTNVISRLSMNAPSATVMRCSSTVEQKPIYDVKSGAGNGSQSIQSSSAPITPLESIITTQPLPSYSCRKNVKRHRMAVHKLSAEEVSRPMSAAQSVGSMGDSPPLQSLGQQATNRMPLARNDYKSDGHVMGSSQQMAQPARYQERANNSWMSPHQMQNSHAEGNWSRSREYVDDEESAETARIAAELKRSAEQ
ncbi:hypothetical protein GCK32_015112, partial [Trichostrongylus colubriformis]